MENTFMARFWRLRFSGKFEILFWAVTKHIKVDFVKLIQSLDCDYIHL